MPACQKPRFNWCPPEIADAVGMMLAGLDGAIDRIVPRGGKGLVARVQTEARLPVFRASRRQTAMSTWTGRPILAMAKSIVPHSKMRRTGVCGAGRDIAVSTAPRHRPTSCHWCAY